FEVACLGRIVAEQRLDDGRYNILLRGLARIRLLKEVHQGKQYRSARVEVLTETELSGPELDRQLRRKMTKLVPTWFPGQGAALDQFRKLLKSDLPLGALCDVITFALPLDLDLKQKLLEELDVEQRVRCLLRHLGKNKPPVPEERKFPPEFSVN